VFTDILHTKYCLLQEYGFQPCDEENLHESDELFIDTAFDIKEENRKESMNRKSLMPT
jgi:hypothetical protein